MKRLVVLTWLAIALSFRSFAANTCIALAVDLDVNDGQSGYIINYKVVVNNGTVFVDRFTSAFSVPFGTSAATALATWKATIVSTAAGRGVILTTNQITIYGAAIN